MDKVLEARGLTLDSYLKISYGIMKIPYTQRPYEWGKVQIARLFYDFCSVYENKVDQHILNFITLYKENELINIYDGQQRTVSTFIILCALLNKLKELPDCDMRFIDRIKKDYIVDEDLFTNEIKYKLSFDKQETNEFYRKYIIEDNELVDDSNLSGQEKAIYSNYKEVKNNLIDKTLGTANLNKSIRELLAAILRKVYVIVLETSNEDIANQMFETLNNTGKKLADFYVLKNQLVRLLGENNVKPNWDIIEKNLDGISKNKFLVAYVSVFYGKTSDSSAYKAIETSNKISNSTEARKTLEELRVASEAYLYLDSPRIRYNTDNVELNRFENLVETLKMVSANQYKSVIVAMELKGFSFKDVNRVLKSLLDLHLRNIFISQDLANTLESFYPNLAKRIYLENLNVNEILEDIDKRKNKGSVLKQKFTGRIIKTDREKKIIRYILRKIYDFENNEEVRVLADAQHVNLEHILPQNPSQDSEWVNTFKDIEERDLLTHNIGNLTLLLGSKNSSGGNQDFEAKKQIYKQSAIQHNNKIAELEKWNQKSINKRVLELYDLFIQVW